MGYFSHLITFKIIWFLTNPMFQYDFKKSKCIYLDLTLRLLTRSIKVSCLSCFLLTLSHLLWSVLRLAPGYPPEPFTTLCTRINYEPLINLVPRYCASAHLSNLYSGINFRPPINLVPRSHQHAINFVPWRQKARHTCLATGITSRLKYRD